MNPSSFWVLRSVLIFPFQWISQCYVARCSSWQPSLRHSFFLQNQKFPVNKCFLPCDVVCWMFITILAYWILTPTMWKTHTFCVFGHDCSYFCSHRHYQKFSHLFITYSVILPTWILRDRAENLITLKSISTTPPSTCIPRCTHHRDALVLPSCYQLNRENEQNQPQLAFTAL